MTHYFLGNRLLGSSPRPAMWSDESPQVDNTVLLCKHCGEAWGRVVLGADIPWTFLMRDCPKHNGGSFIAPWRNGFKELPPEVITYEFHLLLNKEST